MEYTGQAASRFVFADILYEKKDGVARVTLNRPEIYNAYSSDTLHEMKEAFRDASMDDAVGVLVLTGAGDKAFCSGSDAREFSTEFLRRPRNLWKFQGLLAEALNFFRHLGKPTIARLNGVVAGGGMDWNLAADLAIAADHVRFMQMGTRMGLVDAWGATQWLPLVVGERRAREMLLTCDEVPAEQALAWGLVNQVVPLKQLDRGGERPGQEVVAEISGEHALYAPATGHVEGPGLDAYHRPRSRLACGARDFLGDLRGHPGVH